MLPVAMTFFPGSLTFQFVVLGCAAILAGSSLFRIAGRTPRRADLADDDLGKLMRGGWKASWPVWWLVPLFLINRDLAWSALLTTIGMTALLPVALMAMLWPTRVNVSANRLLVGLMLVAAVAMIATGIGLDRTFNRIDGLLMFNLLLLAVWSVRQEKGTDADKTASLNFSSADPPRAALSIVATVVDVVIYHTAVLAMIVAITAIGKAVPIHRGIGLGVALGLAWLPASIRWLRRTAAPVSVSAARTLVMLYLIGAATLVFGAVDYPFSLWQMEAALLTLTAIFWLIRSGLSESLSRPERHLLFVLCLIYLLLRCLRLPNWQ